MRTQFIMLLGISIIFILTVCISMDDKEKSTEEKKQNKTDAVSYDIKARGIVERIGVSTWMYGTHVLKDKDGDILYALKSETVELSVYEGKTIVAAGSLVPGYPVDGGPKYLKVVDVLK